MLRPVDVPVKPTGAACELTPEFLGHAAVRASVALARSPFPNTCYIAVIRLRRMAHDSNHPASADAEQALEALLFDRSVSLGTRGLVRRYLARTNGEQGQFTGME